LGTLEMAGQEQKLHGFTFTLGYSRRMVAEAALDQNWARCCGCTKPRSSRSAECRKKFSTTA